MRSLEDKRIQELQNILDWTLAWNQQWEQHGKTKHAFISIETYEDLLSMLMGTIAILKLKFAEYPISTISLHRLNSDVVENNFCSQRGMINGANTNPTYLRYCKAMNTIIMSQAVVSKVSNAGGLRCVGGALPYKHHTGKSFKSMRL